MYLILWGNALGFRGNESDEGFLMLEIWKKKKCIPYSGHKLKVVPERV